MTIPSLHINLDHDNFFEKYNLDIQFPPSPIVKEPPLLEKAWKKVCSFFIRFWRTLCFWRTDSNFKLTDRQIKLIKEAKEERIFFAQKLEESKPPSKLIKSPSATRLPKSPYIPQYPKDKTLRDFCSFVENFSEILVLECINEQTLKPKVPELKSIILDNLSQVKKWVDVISNLKKAASPILNKFGNLDDPILTILAQQLLQIFLKPLEKGEDPERELEEAIVNRIKFLKLKGEISQEEYEKIKILIPSTLKWLFNSNNWLINSQHPVLLHNFFIDCFNFFESFSNLTKRGVLDTPLEKIKTQVEETFESDIQEALKLNTKPIANIIGSRISELIGSIPYQETFNEILRIVIKQMEGWILADKQWQEYNTLIKNAEYDTELKAKTIIEVKKQQAAQSFLGEVKEEGGKEEYLNNKFLQSFAGTPSCHPMIKKFIEAGTSKVASKIEDEIFDSIIESILPYLFPPTTIKLPDGSKIEVSGIANLIDEVFYPRNLQALLIQADQMVGLIVENGQFKDKENFSNYLNSLRKVVLTQIVDNKIKDILKDGIKTLFNKIASIEYLEEVSAALILPALIEVIFVGWARTTIERNIKTFSSLFHKFIETTENATLCHVELNETLYDMILKQTVDFNMNDAGITKEKFNEIIKPLILEIVTNLLKRLKSDNPQKKISVNEVKVALEQYLKAEDVPSNPLYSDITMKALFKIGDFKLPILNTWTETVVNWCSNSITEQASIALHDVESSYHKSATSLVVAGNKHLLNAEALNRLFYPPNLTEKQQEEKQEKVAKALSENIHRISALTHDILYCSLGTWNWPPGSIAKKFTPETSTLEQTISSIFTKFLSRPILNKNIFILGYDVINKALGKTVGNIQAASKLQSKVTKISSQGSTTGDIFDEEF